MKPPKELKNLYTRSIQQARAVFGKNFTSKLGIAPAKEEYEVAVIPRKNAGDTDWDNVQVCLLQFHATFLTAYLRIGEQRVLAIETGSGAIRELWGMVEPIIKSIDRGEIGFTSYGEAERHTVKLIIPVKIAEELGLPEEKPFHDRDELNEWAGINMPESVLDKVKIVEMGAQ